MYKIINKFTNKKPFLELFADNNEEDNEEVDEGQEEDDEGQEEGDEGQEKGDEGQEKVKSVTKPVIVQPKPDIIQLKPVDIPKPIIMQSKPVIMQPKPLIVESKQADVPKPIIIQPKQADIPKPVEVSSVEQKNMVQNIEIKKESLKNKMIASKASAMANVKELQDKQNLSLQKCVDLDNNCKNWAKEGQCKLNADLILDKCKVSCDICGKTDLEIGMLKRLYANEAIEYKKRCPDKDNQCEMKANNSECKSNPNYMLEFCRTSCKVCGLSQDKIDSLKKEYRDFTKQEKELKQKELEAEREKYDIIREQKKKEAEEEQRKIEQIQKGKLENDSKIVSNNKSVILNMKELNNTFCNSPNWVYNSMEISVNKCAENVAKNPKFELGVKNNVINWRQSDNTCWLGENLTDRTKTNGMKCYVMGTEKTKIEAEQKVIITNNNSNAAKKYSANGIYCNINEKILETETSSNEDCLINTINNPDINLGTKNNVINYNNNTKKCSVGINVISKSTDNNNICSLFGPEVQKYIDEIEEKKRQEAARQAELARQEAARQAELARQRELNNVINSFTLRGGSNDYCRGPGGANDTSNSQFLGNVRPIEQCAKQAIDNNVTGFDYMDNGNCYGFRHPYTESYQPQRGSDSNKGCYIKKELTNKNRDQNQNCNVWANSGECFKNPNYMLEQCRASCGVTNKSDGDINNMKQDYLKRQNNQNPNCNYWASTRECVRNPGYMLEMCAPACKTSNLTNDQIYNLKQDYVNSTVFLNNNENPNKVVGGNESNGTPLYVCNAEYNNGIHPGKTRDDWNGCYIGWGGRAIFNTNYKLLDNKPNNYYWDKIPTNKVVGGRENNQNLYICKGKYNQGVHPGKIGENWGNCNIAWGDKEIGTTDFEYLNKKL